MEVDYPAAQPRVKSMNFRLVEMLTGPRAGGMMDSGNRRLVMVANSP